MWILCAEMVWGGVEVGARLLCAQPSLTWDSNRDVFENIWVVQWEGGQRDGRFGATQLWTREPGDKRGDGDGGGGKKNQFIRSRHTHTNQQPATHTLFARQMSCYPLHLQEHTRTCMFT